MPVKPKSWGYVYIVRCLDRYKIGWSGDLKTLRRRLKVIGLMNAYPVTTEVVLCSRRAHRIETDLHKRYAACRVNGEWFAITPADVAQLKQEFRRYLVEL